MITRVISSLSLVFLSFACFAQEADSIFSRPDISAEFQGGKSEMHKFIAKNLKHPSCNVESENYKGLYRLTIEKNGEISNVEIAGSFPEVDQSVVTCLESMPNWIPATYKGKPVRSTFLLPVMIHLRE